MEERWRAWFGESLRELVETPLRASALLRAILMWLKWSTTKTAPPRQHLPLRGRHNILFLQLLIIFCLYICSTYKCDSICNILSFRALLVDQLSAFIASPRVHNKPYNHRLHKGISQSDYRISFFETRIFISPLFTFRPLFSIAALHMLKHSTTLSPALEASLISVLHLQLQLIHEWKVLHEYDSMKTENWIFFSKKV